MKIFSKEELEIFDILFPNRTNDEIAKVFQIKVSLVKEKAEKRGLKKCKTFLSTINTLNRINEEKSTLFQLNKIQDSYLYDEMNNFAKKIGYKTPGLAISELSEGGKYNGAIIFKKKFNEFKKAI